MEVRSLNHLVDSLGVNMIVLGCGIYVYITICFYMSLVIEIVNSLCGGKNK